jgi:hypothetical protein
MVAGSSQGSVGHPPPTALGNVMIKTASRVLAVIILATGLVWYGYQTFMPPDAVTIRSAASFCRRDYASARTAGDTASIDDRVWQVDFHTWRRLPRCGELRRAGRL